MKAESLSEHNFYQLKSINPALGQGWRKTIDDILPNLGKKIQENIYESILKPKNIARDAEGKVTYTYPEALEAIIEGAPISSIELLSVAQYMQKTVDPSVKERKAKELADEVEALLSRLDEIDVGDSLLDNKLRQKIRLAYLYDLAKWIDGINLIVDSGIRRLDVVAAKSYFKEVFLKHQIQGREFRYWDSSDLNFSEYTHLPVGILKEGKDRRFHVVEGMHHWHVIGSANKLDENPYSFRRFLNEDCSGGAKKFIYLTHLTLRKNDMKSTQYIEHVTYCFSRLYTLDLGISDSMLNFVTEVKQIYAKYLKPLLLKEFDTDGSNPEDIIRRRMIEYEKQLSILVLNKIPRVAKLAINNKNDQDYLFYHLDQVFKQILDDIEFIKLQPFLMYSVNVDIMVIKLLALREMLNQLSKELKHPKLGLDEYANKVKTSLTLLKQKYEAAEVEMEELSALKSDLDEYYEIQKNGSFWQKLTHRKAPEYSLEDLVATEQSLHENFFISIIRLAKTEKESMIYLEFYLNEVINKGYRHYAIADGEMGVSRLPRIVRLNENRHQFKFYSIKEPLYLDIFKANQDWSLNR